MRCTSTRQVDGASRRRCPKLWPLARWDCAKVSRQRSRGTDSNSLRLKNRKVGGSSRTPRPAILNAILNPRLSAVDQDEVLTRLRDRSIALRRSPASLPRSSCDGARQLRVVDPTQFVLDPIHFIFVPPRREWKQCRALLRHRHISARRQLRVQLRPKGDRERTGLGVHSGCDVSGDRENACGTSGATDD